MRDSQEARRPLSAAQHGIWLGQQFDLKSPVYNAGECIEICGPVDPALFEAAVRQAVSEAEALHVRFVSSETGPQQLLGPPEDWTLHMADLSEAADPWAAVQAWMKADLAQTVDLSRGPLFTEALFKAAPDRFFWYQRVHHIAMDGFGFSLLARRVAEVYTAKAAGRPVTGGFGSFQAVLDEDVAYRNGPQYELDRTFWTQRFADRPTPVGLAPPAPMSSSFVRQTRFLSTQSMEQLQAVSRTAGLNWPDLMLAATAVYLHRLTDAAEVVLGLPVMTRLGSAALRVPCMAMNIVPLRVPVSPEASLLDVARRVAAEVRAMRPHLRYRYEQLRRDLKMVGGQRRLFGPVVNIMPFDYALRFAGIPTIAHNISAGPVEDLSIGLYARSDGKGMRIDFDANPTCYEAKDLDTHQGAFLELLESLVAAPGQAVGQVQNRSPSRLPPTSSTGSLLSSVLDGGPLPVSPRPVLQLITERAHEQPDAIAVEHGQHQLSYRDLLQNAQALSAQLVREGVQPNTPVAVMLPRGIDAIVASLGVLFSGAGYLPLDPQGPSSRTAAILEDAKPALIIQRASPEADPMARGNLVIRRNEAAPAAAPSSQVQTEGERLAYVIYTSGSTGQPNGVQISQDALAHFVAGATHRYGVQRSDRVLQFAPLHFDASVEEIFLTLCAGAKLVLRTEEMLQSVPRLLDACAEHGISVLDLPTAFWHELAYSVSTGAARLPSSIRLVIIGGEAALPERVARWRSAVGPAVLLLNTYGPTEATVVATTATLSGPLTAGAPEEEIPIGRPLPGVLTALIDAHGKLATPGAEGELYLLGGGLARGYLGRPELNAARFTPLGALPGNPRAYRTGDKARVREDGQLVFTGRVDDEFKISGHRIDPTEIETVLLAHAGVREAAVVGQILPGGTRRLCAHIVAENPAPAAAELRRHLLAELPAAMVPSAFVFSEKLPRTSTGKLDRNTLRLTLPPEDTAPAADATAFERLVLQVWEQVLGLGGMSAQDDFFELGGQSLQTIQVANRLSVALGREVPVATVFRYPTAAGLAQALEHGEKDSQESGGLSPAMLADAELPEEIVPRLVPRQSPPTPLRQVLLTGATGFVGAHLLDQLLRQTQAKVVCLVRARDEVHAMERLREAMTGQRLSTASLAERVMAVPADLGQPWLGLSSARFHSLAAECDAILHNAAVVSVVREYGSLQATNVRGTRELLRLAAAVRPKPLHYVSTLAVAPQANLSPEVPEAFVPAHPGLRDGYQQSKWVAERLVQHAAERGLPVTVYRLGRVSGAMDSGIVNPQDLVWRILLAGIPAGALPQLDVGEVWTPVDYVASALVRLSLVSHPGAVFNVTPAPEVRLSEVFGWVRDYGYPVELCPVPEWRARVAQAAGSANNSATLAFFDLRAGSSEPTFGLGTLRSDRLLQALSGSGISCPGTDRPLLHRYLDYCVEQGLLQRPPKTR
ncbi:myxochelin non-ribosomal peptide synthetase MxcG [Stigmatella aurantiaca]|uniref:NAD dependent epimerase/dehydratase family n=1 Tax=Stigmatella aurantiaca (strain DW4/3-1) TaxID=378806 RepID=Q096Z6_STIAD|nr:myxochelin non-ribosomal peptide synthetase MxcG [Stigmatella aurantiaca]ADO71384.1 Non-ribosomal peptide synthase MxcG [Stigmatella aurantiaca DW4/3-1]EAU67767.1 NAD dependent epimerase/dehydratase family [Stigmatella aurantiaca DW4/3-1]